MHRHLWYGAAAVLLLSACNSDKSTGPSITKPAVDSIAPRRGTTGTVVRLYGAGFDTDSLAVFFGALESPLVQQDSGAWYATVPEGVTAGTTYDVRVLNKGVKGDTLAAAFQVVAPTVSRVNGATKPTGLVGMTVLIEGQAFGDYSHGKVFFTTSTGTPIQAAIADTANDWSDNYVVTTVPQGVSDTSTITVQTATGTSAPITFTLVTGAQFSPSVINWTKTTPLPRALQGLGAAFLPSANAGYPTNYVFTIGGAADSTNAATTDVYSAAVQSSGAVGAWGTMTPLPAPRAYQATAAATAYNAAVDTTTTAGFLYALGGVDSAGKTVGTVYVGRVALDGTIAGWQPTTPLPRPLHSASAVVFRGFVYLMGGADSTNAAQAAGYRAAVNGDGTLGAWQPVASLPQRAAYLSLVNFGPYIYAVGGDSGTVAPVQATTSGTEISNVSLARINLRDGSLPASWAAVTALGKARAKHSTVVAGGYLFTSSGIYSGAAGSSENTYAPINSDGTNGSWLGATGSNTITNVLGYDLYNQAAIAFTDDAGQGHVLVLGGAKRQAAGRASAAVVYY